MLYVLLSVVAVVLIATVWAARRRVAAAAWNRELEAAFDVAARRELPTRPVL